MVLVVHGHSIVLPIYFGETFQSRMDYSHPTEHQWSKDKSLPQRWEFGAIIN
jgi:hypothetical protein